MASAGSWQLLMSPDGLFDLWWPLVATGDLWWLQHLSGHLSLSLSLDTDVFRRKEAGRGMCWRHESGNEQNKLSGQPVECSVHLPS